MEKKLAGYKRKLLDTGRRNRLINFKKSYISTVELQFDNFYELYKNFIGGNVFTFAKLFNDLDDFIDIEEENIDERLANALGKTVYYKKRYDKEEIKEIRTRFKPLKGKNYLYSTSVYNILNRVLLLLKKKSQLYYEENGVNALYLCFGFLNYQEEKQEYMAPLVLVPCTLNQKTIQDDFKIKALDEDYNINENLIHKFKNDYKIDLAPSEAGMDIKAYLAEVALKVEKLNFTVSEDVWLGLFSFSKILMYRDIIDNEDKIKSSEVIKAFCDLPSQINKDIKVTDINLDTVEDINSQNQVLYADSSQYKSIYFAKKGLSFVLQGPPGTGKSQTITNILAELIGMDKHVLFVCEKKSALEVVYRNLKKKNLDMYALPMFDTKANKKDIVKGIYENLEGIQNNRETISTKAKDILATVENSKEELSNYFKEITTIIKPINMSLYQIAGMLEENNDIPLLDFKIDNVLNISEAEFKDYLNKIEIFSAMVKRLGDDPSNHPFYLFNRNKLSMTLESKLKKEILKAVGALDNLIKLLQAIRNTLKFEVVSFENISSLEGFLSGISSIKHIPDTYLDYTNMKETYANFKKIVKLQAINKALKREFLAKYKVSFLDIDSESIMKDMEEKYNKKIKRVFGFKKIDSYLEDFLLTKRNMKYEEEYEDLVKLQNYKKNFYSIASLESEFNEKFADYYFGALTNFDELESIIKNLEKIEEGRKLINPLIPFNELAHLLNKDESIVFIEMNMSKLSDYLAKGKASLEVLNEYFDYDLTKENPLAIASKLHHASIEFDRVNEYIDFIKAYQQIDPRLASFKKEALQKRLKSNELTSSFKKRFAVLFLDEYLFNHSGLDVFSNTYMNHLIKKYQTNDNKSLEISKIKIKDNVTASWPQLDSLMANNLEVKTLVMEANKKRKLKTLRTLFREIPNILMDLKPIFMMSPLSVATYLDPNAFHFDTVIFDEASQITAENAIGAMYRGNQVIIVGDNEQLPPTSFFDSTDSDEEDEDYDIYESILDQALVSLPKIMLKWHYRSKDESLIAFSNKEIYHDLTSFPSDEQSDSLGVRLEYVENAIYEHGKRINVEEAKRAVDLVYNIIKETPSKSCGVVTFNMAQQVYIERLINKLRMKDPTIEEYFADDKLEGFFVKNLETVQGDERDIIILSTTFGPDEKGKLSMNFGPINKEGGYRRLNVAITRAKEEVILCTSMRPSDFRLAQTTNRGVIMLHDYIKYAEEAHNIAYKGEISTDGIINSISNYLTNNGYKVITNLGCSGYKIDLAVVNPKNERQFSLAILADGINYQSLKTIRDRNHLMDEVLRQRGWKIYHVWSLSYIRNKSSILSEIVKELTKDDKNEQDNTLITNDFAVKTEKNELHVEELFSFYPDAKNIISKYSTIIETQDKIVDEIINELAPIHIDELKKLLLPLYGKSRMTAQVSQAMDEEIDNLVSQKRYFKIIGFLLKPSDLYGVTFRRYNYGLYYPSIEYVYVEELENGLITIIEHIKTTSKKILYQTFNELVGYAKGSTLTYKTLDNVINVLQDKGRINLDGEIIDFIE